MKRNAPIENPATILDPTAALAKSRHTGVSENCCRTIAHARITHATIDGSVADNTKGLDER